MWYLEIHSDGSGIVGLGANANDFYSFKKGSFDVEKVTKELKALTTDEKGGIPSHFGFSFQSERKAGEPLPYRYTRDGKLILALFKKAIVDAQVKKNGGGKLLRERYPQLSQDK